MRPISLPKGFKSELTQERLCEVLKYEPETGVFTWRMKRGRAVAGSIAGKIWTNPESQQSKYRIIRVDGHSYKAHRLAWLAVYGVWPKLYIDHIDGNGLNNAIGNLRLATLSQNQHNRGLPKNSKSGLKGVSYFSKVQRWGAQIVVNGKHHWLGYFDEPNAAHAAYCEAAVRLHKDFARVS